MPRSFLIKKKNKGPRVRRPDSRSPEKAHFSGNTAEDKDPASLKSENSLEKEAEIHCDSGDETVDVETVDDADDQAGYSSISEAEQEEGDNVCEQQTAARDAGLSLSPRDTPPANINITPENVRGDSSNANEYNNKYSNLSAQPGAGPHPTSQPDAAAPPPKKPRTLSFHSVEDLIRPDPKSFAKSNGNLHVKAPQDGVRGPQTSPRQTTGCLPQPLVKDRPVFASVPPRVTDPHFWQNNVPNLPQGFGPYFFGFSSQKFARDAAREVVKAVRGGGAEAQKMAGFPLHNRSDQLPPRDAPLRDMYAGGRPSVFPLQRQTAAVRPNISPPNMHDFRRDVTGFGDNKLALRAQLMSPALSGKVPWPLAHELSPENAPPLSPEKRKQREGEPPRYQCESCGKSYSTFSGLSKHKQFHCVNQVKKQFNCKHCEKTYTSLGALKMHIRTHTLPCKCKMCGKAFSRPWLLQGHVRTHTGEKPFSCQHCGRAFADRSNLRAHLQTHSDVKKYSCKTCSKTFSRMSLLLKHEDGGCTGSF